MESRFECSCCGCCCEQVGSSLPTSFLDRGDGVCRYFDDSSRLCSIYLMRPLICRVDEAYEILFAETMTRKEYLDLNKKLCFFLSSHKRGE